MKERKKDREKERKKERENRSRKIMCKQKLVENVICKLRRWKGLTIFFYNILQNSQKGFFFRQTIKE